MQHGYWHARSLEYTATTTARIFEWARLPGDLVFIVFGPVPLTIAAFKAWVGMRAAKSQAG